VTNSILTKERISATDILDRVSMLQVLGALGFAKPIKNRTRCILHSGDSPTTFSFNSAKGVWYCFKCNQGGGKVRPVQLALGLDRGRAFEWLANLAGISSGVPWTEAERQEWARRRRAAEIEARDFLAWRNGLLQVLRDARDTHFAAYHRAKNYIIRHGIDSTLGLLAADLGESSEAKYLELDHAIALIKNASYDVLVRYYRAVKLAEAA
jgi:hypothetical protein